MTQFERKPKNAVYGCICGPVVYVDCNGDRHVATRNTAPCSRPPRVARLRPDDTSCCLERCNPPTPSFLTRTRVSFFRLARPSLQSARPPPVSSARGRRPSRVFFLTERQPTLAASHATRARPQRRRFRRGSSYSRRTRTRRMLRSAETLRTGREVRRRPGPARPRGGRSELDGSAAPLARLAADAGVSEAPRARWNVAQSRPQSRPRPRRPRLASPARVRSPAGAGGHVPDLGRDRQRGASPANAAAAARVRTQQASRTRVGNARRNGSERAKRFREDALRAPPRRDATPARAAAANSRRGGLPTRERRRASEGSLVSDACGRSALGALGARGALGASAAFFSFSSPYHSANAELRPPIRASAAAAGPPPDAVVGENDGYTNRRRGLNWRRKNLSHG